MRRIRVLRVITWLPVGGIERKIVEVLPRLNPARFEVSLVCIRERGPLADELEARGVRVDLVPFRSRWDPRGIRALARLMRERDTDLVHSHMYRSNVPATAAARLARVPHVFCQIHNVGTWESARQLAMDRWLCRWREGVIAVSDQVRREAIDRLKLPPEKVRLIYNGVDLARFGSGAGREELRREHGADEGDLVFLMLARMVEQKRPQDFLALADRLLRREREAGGARPRAHFWLVGDGKLLPELRRQAADLPMPERVRFFGRRDDVERIMAAADAFVMPSTKEGFSNALVEALASGLAVVAADVGGNAEAVRDGVDGLIVPPLSPDALFAAGDRLIEDRAFRRKLSEAARARAETFSLDRMIENVETLYMSAMRGDANI